MDQIWAWLPRGHRLAVGVRDPLKSSVTGPSFLVNCYLEIKFHKKIPIVPPPPLNRDRDRDRDRDHKSAFDRDRDRDSSKLPIPVPGFPVPGIPVDYWAILRISWKFQMKILKNKKSFLVKSILHLSRTEIIWIIMYLFGRRLKIARAI